MFRSIPPADQVVDAEYTVADPAPQTVSKPPPREGVIYLNQESGQQVMVMPTDYEQRARMASLFLKVPFMAYLALNRDLPPLVRLLAAGLGVLEVSQIVKEQDQIEQMLP